MEQRLTSLVAYAFALTVMSIAGCQSSGLVQLPGAAASRLVRTSNDETRFRDDTLRESTETTFLKEEVSANYGTLQSRFEGSTVPKTAPKPGHAFLQPKARLGRPVPLPQQVAGPSEGITSHSGQTGGNLPGASNQQVPPVNGSTSGSVVPGTRLPATPALPGNSPWGQGGQPWKSADASSESGRDSTGVPAQPAASGSKWGWTAPKQNGLPISQDSSSGSDITAESIPNGAMQPIPREHFEEGASESENPETLSPGAEDNSMLGRLRSFYPPRLDAGTDRIRKQFRRFPDPFGILKEREAEASETETAELSPPAGASDVQELTEPAQAEQSVVSADIASPATPIEAAIQQVERELSVWPRTGSGQPERIDEWRKRQTDLRLLQMIAGRSAESIRMIESLPVDEQEYWQAMMLSMNQFRDVDPITPRRDDVTETLNHLRTAGRRLQPLAALEIQRLMFCSRIDGFGNVAQFPTADFEPGQRILLYAGLRNFRSELTPEGKFRTEFAAEIEFRRAGDDESIETIRLPQILDECDEERTDYYQSFELTAPALEGDYVVRITLRDMQGNQTAISELEISIH